MRSLVADPVSAFRNSRGGGGISACAFNTSPAVVLIAPRREIVALLCAVKDSWWGVTNISQHTAGLYYNPLETK